LLTICASYVALNLIVHPQAGRPEIASACAFLFGSSLFCMVAAILLESQRRRLFQMQQQLTAQNAELVRAQGHQREFLRTVTHELRTPLNSVLGFVELIESEDRTLSASTGARLRRMRAASSRLLGVINDILDLSRIEAGKFEVHFAVCDIGKVIHDVAEETRALIRDRPVEVVVDSPVSLLWKTDEKRLRQILINLAGNAAKFTPSGEIRLEVRSSNSHLHLTVRDTGVGISAHDLQYVLEPFAQAEHGRVAGGTGLGLHISSRLVALLGGTIDLESELDRGTTFRVAVPQPDEV